MDFACIIDIRLSFSPTQSLLSNPNHLMIYLYLCDCHFRCHYWPVVESDFDSKLRVVLDVGIKFWC